MLKNDKLFQNIYKIHFFSHTKLIDNCFPVETWTKILYNVKFSQASVLTILADELEL